MFINEVVQVKQEFKIYNSYYFHTYAYICNSFICNSFTCMHIFVIQLGLYVILRKDSTFLVPLPFAKSYS